MMEKEYIQSLTDESVALLKEMVAIPSPSFSEGEVCSHICRWMESRCMQYERIGNNIVAEHIIGPDRPTLMLCAHIDTVAPCDGYDFDPYTPDYEIAAKVIGEALGRPCRPDEIVAGLGSNDDGASAVAMIAAYRYFCSLRPSRGRGHGMHDRATPLAAGVASDKQRVQWTFAASSHEVGGVVLKPSPHSGHQVTAPEADVRLRIFRVYPFHQVGAVEVSGSFTGYDVIFHK